MNEREAPETLLEPDPAESRDDQSQVDAGELPSPAPDTEPTPGLALVRGFPDAMRTLAAWARRPLRVLVPWLLFSAFIAVVVLLLVWLVASVSSPAPSRPAFMPGLPPRDATEHTWYLFRRNLLVLGLHAFACLAGYIVYASRTDPTLAGGRRMQAATKVTARIALVFIPAATLLSIATQAWILGSITSTAAAHSFVTVRDLVASTLPHSALELTAVFLPLAAWLTASRRGAARDLYAATIASVVVALPMLLGAAWIESNQWHERVQALDTHLPKVEGSRIGMMLPDLERPRRAVELTIGPAWGNGRRYLDVEKLQNDTALASLKSGRAMVGVRLGVGWYIHELRGRSADPCSGRATGRRHPMTQDDGTPAGFIRVPDAIAHVDDLRTYVAFGPLERFDPREQEFALSQFRATACDGSGDGPQTSV
jgi:hypothetical protein